jgi:hypothetical protein
MARGRCQGVAEAFVRPWEEADGSHPIARDPFRVRKRGDPYVAAMHDKDEPELEPRWERGAEGLATEQLVLVRARACYSEQLLVRFELEDRGGRRRRPATQVAISRPSGDEGRPRHLPVMTASTLRRVFADHALS